jgi:glycine/D-amino acid oxidase-like deaminating enzyme
MSNRIVIIGGGAIGCAIAYFLIVTAAAGKQPSPRITVIERDITLQNASSSRSASSIRQQFSTPISIALSMFGFEFMASCERASAQYGGGIGLTPCGYVFLGGSEESPRLRSQTALARSLGVNVTELDRDQLSVQFPWMRTDDLTYAVQGMAGEGWFDGYSLMQWFRARAREGGVRFVRGNAIRYETTDSLISRVRLGNGESVEGDVFVNAGGAWSAALATSLGIDVPVRARRRSAFMVSCPTRLPHMPILIDKSGIYLRPEQNHFLCLVSPKPENDGDNLILEPNFTEFEDVIWPTLADRIPAFEALRVERAWAGYSEYNTIDQNGIVGRIGPENSFIAAGFSGHGLMHSPGIGRGMAELLLHDAYLSLDLSAMSFLRFAAGALLVEHAVI